MKTLVVCIDGTWNHPGQKDVDPVEKFGQVSETNVLRVYRFLTGIQHASSVQITHGLVRPLTTSSATTENLGEAIYLSGVGSAGTYVAKAWEGATGTGTSERILEAYQFLAERFEEHDRIFGFGFSRGAFAVRSLAGFLEVAGLPAPRRTLNEVELDDLYRTYRKRLTEPPGTPQGRNVQG